MDDTYVNLEAGLVMCSDACAGAGHRLHPIQSAVVASTPSSWVDGFASSSDDVVEFVGLDGATKVLWHHLGLGLAGEPVAFHPVAGVLSVRGALLNVVAG
jgi:hypothetical protein